MVGFALWSLRQKGNEALLCFAGTYCDLDQGLLQRVFAYRVPREAQRASKLDSVLRKLGEVFKELELRHVQRRFQHMSLNYVMLGSNDVENARGFYDAVLPAIGGTLTAEYMPHAFCYALRGGGRVWIATPYNRDSAVSGNGNMVGFACESKEEVQAAHRIALAAGGAKQGDPGPRPLYGPDFYGAYVRDFDGNKMSFVYLGEDNQ